MSETFPPPAKAPFLRGRPAKIAAVIIGVVVLVGVGFAAYGVVSDDLGGSSGDTVNVSLRVESDGQTADITFGALGKSAQANGADVPWIRNSTIDSEGAGAADLLSIVAQADGGASYISCKILVGTKTISENQSTGPYAVVSC